ncbi:alpha/beta fold hydrolase [Mycoplasma todarodis]|uniref:Triacylglycerol lipase n=1 Tax=Mycoplasma todarodis TaxID=1937191 RepID=A0A4R0XVK0_9MOLU|nr:alpha/beta hydrolase [Mycoplasma todarodis]TCG10961.1 triacylglycerol lipase [Mycoplasma todarodis]
MNKLFKHFENNGKKKMVFLHGFNSNGNFIQPLLKLEREYDIISFDFPGCGNEDAGDETITIETYAKFAIEKINTLTEPFILVGHSLGGAIAMNIANHPLVSKVVLLAPLNPFAYQEGIESWLLPTSAQDALNSMQSLVGNDQKEMYFNNIINTAGTFLKNTLPKMDIFKYMVFNQITNQKYLNEILMDKYLSNQKDVILIQGDIDKFIAKESSDKTCKTFKYRKIILKNTGHSIVYERENELNTILNSISKD